MYEKKTVNTLRKDALNGNVQAISELTDLYNEVFHQGDPYYPGGVAEAVPEIKLGNEPKEDRGPSYDEKRKAERYDSVMYMVERKSKYGDQTE